MSLIKSVIVVILLIINFSNLGNAQCVVVPPVPQDACYNQVIANDSWCCNVSWDGICQAAYDACGPPPPPPPPPGPGGCNTDISICTPGVAGPFSFAPASPDPSSCLDYWQGAAAPNYAYIILYITTAGNLNILLNGNAATGCLDVSIFDITGQADPCASLGPATE